MVRLNQVLTVAYFGVLAVGFVGVVVISSGNARPYIAPTRLPFGGGLLFVAFAVLLGGGAMMSGKLTTRLAKRAASKAGLEPAEADTHGPLPVFADTRRGHPVRVRTVSDVGGEFTLTMVEAVLSARQSAGMVLQPDDADGIQPLDLGESAVRRDGIAVASDDPEFARQVADGITPETVAAPGRVGQIYAGDTQTLASALDRASVLDTHEQKVQRALPRDGSGEGVEQIRDELGAIGNVVRDEIEGLGTDAATVVHYTAGTILDGDELDRQIAAVVETATAVDDAEGVQSKE
jgi:hypothetical protein